MKNNGINHALASGRALTVAAEVCPARNGARLAGARKIEQSIAYMMQHLNQPIQVAKLAETAHTSPSHFFALFKRWAGFSPIDYFIRLRMRRASRLLANTSMSVKEIAAALGYDDPFYFSRLFKSVHGTAPSEYRLMRGQLEQADRPGAMGGVEQEGLSPQVSFSPPLENNGGNGRVGYEKIRNNDILPSARGNFVVAMNQT
jgi:AraC-like DNA-binding protein